MNNQQKEINEIIKNLQIYNLDITKSLDLIFKNPNLTNVFLKQNQFMTLLLNYIIITKNKQFYEIIDYFKTSQDKNIQKIYNNFKFNNGKFNEMVNLQELDDKTINTILIYNNKPTKDEHFNKIFNLIKNTEIMKIDFDKYFNNIYLNNIHQDYHFKFMDKYLNFEKLEEKHEETIVLNPIISFKHISLMDNYILKYNDESLYFKKWMYIILSYVYDKKDLSIYQLLKIFQNFNIVNYFKLITPNASDSNLVTYIYFKSKIDNKDVYIPNLRYTIDIPGNNTDEKVEYLKLFKYINDFKGFKTTIEFDNSGIRFSTKEYNTDIILKYMDTLIKNKLYNEMIFYLFNSQFLNRSTCLFGYFVYFYYTHKILKNTYYFDIIALTESYDDFNKLLNDNNVILVDEFEKIDDLNLNYLIELIK